MIRLILPMPPSVNGLFSGREGSMRRYKSPAYKRWHTRAMPFLRSFLLDIRLAEPIKDNVEAVYRFGEINDKRRRDVANYEKAISDILVETGILLDDHLIKSLTVEWADDVQERMVEIILLPKRGEPGC